MATATVERTRTKSISSATAIPVEAEHLGEDGYPVKVWEVNGVPTPFSLRPFEEHEREVFWNPQGPDAPMWWRAQERNEWGLQPIIQREVWIGGSFSPRNAWERHMTLEWLKTVEGGAAGHTWVGYDTPGHHWVCNDCAWACGVLVCIEQHQSTKRHFKGYKRA